MQIKMITSSADRIIFEANGEEKVLAPSFADNITVASIQEEKAITEDFLKLSSLNAGENAKVLGISKACRGKQRRRLMDLGVVPGTYITALMKSIGGDPVAYVIRDTTIALRKDQADKIFITETEKN
jgi:DtxR family Mn-dependent transcriptional regulator